MTTEPPRPLAPAGAGAARVVPLFSATAPRRARQGAAGNGAEDGLRQLHRYWSELCADGLPPTRASIDPRRIEAILHDTFIIESIAPGFARFRVAGTRLTELMGMDVRGMPISALIQPGGRDRFANQLEAMFRTPAELHLELRSPGGLARPALTARMMILPLRDEQGAVTRAIGCLLTEGRIGRAPRRFEPGHARRKPLLRPARPMPPGATAAAPEIEVPRPAPAPRSHLRLVHSS